MNLATLSIADLIGLGCGFVFTVLVFSYVFGDNVFFRLATHILIGVAAGFAVVVAIYQVIIPLVITPLLAGSQTQRIIAAIPLALGALLFFKLSSRFTNLGNPATAYLVGAGAAAAISGAVLGTIFPQVKASINLFGLQGSAAAWQFLEGCLILVGTLTTLAYFHYGAHPQPGKAPRQPDWIRGIGFIGQFFIAITLGVVFAGVLLATLVAFVERIAFFISLLRMFIQAQ